MQPQSGNASPQLSLDPAPPGCSAVRGRLFSFPSSGRVAVVMAVPFRQTCADARSGRRCVMASDRDGRHDYRRGRLRHTNANTRTCDPMHDDNEEKARDWSQRGFSHYDPRNLPTHLRSVRSKPLTSMPGASCSSQGRLAQPTPGARVRPPRAWAEG
jgi:hypothetical protein